MEKITNKQDVVVLSQRYNAVEQAIDTAMLHQGDQLPSIIQRSLEGIGLSGSEAALLATYKAYVTNLYLYRYMDDLIATSEASISNIARVKAFYRQFEFLRLVGAINDQSLQGVKLCLGAGMIVTDALPLYWDVSVSPDISAITELRDETTEEITQIIDTEIQHGRIQIQTRSGGIVCVDPEVETTSMGINWARVLGIPIDLHQIYARQFLEEQKRDLKGSISFILAARHYPKLFGNANNINKSRQNVQPFYMKVKGLLTREGQFVATIGGSSGRIHIRDMMLCLDSLQQATQKSLRIDNRKYGPCSTWIDPGYMDTQVLIAPSMIRNLP